MVASQHKDVNKTVAKNTEKNLGAVGRRTFYFTGLGVGASSAPKVTARSMVTE